MVYTAEKINKSGDLTGRIEKLFKDRNVKLVLGELNIPETTYYRSMKSGIWKLEHVVNIAKYFDVSLDYLILGKVNTRVLELERELKTARDYLTILLEEKSAEHKTIQGTIGKDN